MTLFLEDWKDVAREANAYMVRNAREQTRILNARLAPKIAAGK